ncbi:MAG: transposase [Bdellovibrionia bacterium]
MKRQLKDESGQQFLTSLLSSRDLQVKLMEDCRNAALKFAKELMEQEVERLAGAKFSHKTEGQMWRGGSDKTRIVVGGEKMQVSRPRVRDLDGDVPLTSLAQLQDEDIFDDEIKERMIRGVSTRNYEPVIKSWSDKLSISKSNVSRAFIRASRKDLEKLNTQDLSEYEFIALMIDGVELAGRTLIVVMGITPECQKIPLGLREGDTENSAVIKDLLTSIRDRNFKMHTDRILAVTDGAKAIKKALKDVFGEEVIVQRCWLHKLRNLQKYIPEHLHKQLWWRMKKLMNLKSIDDAKKDLAEFITWLSEISIEAENSMQEVGMELLTVHALEVNGDLRKSLYSTNPIESMIFGIRHRLGKVKNWKSANKKDQIQRWMASSILALQKKMRRLRGHKHVGQLITKLKTKVDSMEKSA